MQLHAVRCYLRLDLTPRVDQIQFGKEYQAKSRREAVNGHLLTACERRTTAGEALSKSLINRVNAGFSSIFRRHSCAQDRLPDCSPRSTATI
jgi:hypothetical protein